ncbi:MAG: D-lactate dehydrogenase VanH-A [Bauldia sp.]|nr:D-lactate dehydrogenase VanH-A [Bauldia sp.]
MTIPAMTVFGCEPDEADMFAALAPRLGVVATTTGAPVSEASLLSAPRNRCISVGHKSELGRPLFRALVVAGVRHITTRSIGFDHIDLAAAREAGIVVENVVYPPDGVADYTLMLMLMAVRNARGTIGAVANLDFRPGVRGRDLRDMTVGVVGVGNIGEAVIRRLAGFGCSVLAASKGPQVAAPAEFVPLAELLRRSDVVTLHVPLDAGTHHLIGPGEIAAMRQGAVLVNTGRGGLVDTGALVAALESGHLGGAALDVIEGEDGIFYHDRSARRPDHPFLERLLRLPNALITPHTAYYTTRQLHDTVERTLRNCLSFERSNTYA